MAESVTITETVKTKIYTIRGVKVMLDRDLADLYQVNTKVLNQSVKRNIKRFPVDFMFQLSPGEFANWKSQFVTSNSDKMGLRRPPYAFTEHGVSMLSSVINSEIAIEINIKIIRAFVELRQLVAINPEYELLKQRMTQIQTRMDLSSADSTVSGILVEQRFSKLGADVLRVSKALDEFQDGHIVIKRPDDWEGNG